MRWPPALLALAVLLLAGPGCSSSSERADEGPVAASAPGPPPVDTATAVTAAASSAPGLPTACEPRFLGIGDSIAAQSIGPATDRLRAMGFATRLDARWGTGPLDHDPDWLAVAGQLESEFRPTVVLAVFYGNYAQPIDGVAGESQEQYAAWGARVAALTRIFTDGGARVVWLEPPPRPEGTVSGTWGATVTAVSGIPGVSVRRTGLLVAGPDGRWAPDLRDPDRIHLTRAGGDLMAADIVEAALAATGC